MTPFKVSKWLQDYHMGGHRFLRHWKSCKVGDIYHGLGVFGALPQGLCKGYAFHHPALFPLHGSMPTEPHH